MRKVNDEDKAAERSGSVTDKERLFYGEVVGGILLIIVVVGAFAGYYAYNYIAKDSARMQFWVGFMFSFAALVVIIVQSVIYVKQAEFMKQQSDASALLIELMVANERAYVRVESWEKLWIEDGHLKITGTMINAGKTPAWNVVSGSRITLQPTTELPLAPTDGLPTSGGALGAGQTRPFQPQPLKVTGEQIEAIQNGAIIYVDGACSYSDNLGGHQFYTYGFKLSSKLGASPRYERHHREKADSGE